MLLQATQCPLRLVDLVVFVEPSDDVRQGNLGDVIAAVPFQLVVGRADRECSAAARGAAAAATAATSPPAR
eukprot:4046250-Lingulodinium_polyedra.AAC.1